MRETENWTDDAADSVVDDDSVRRMGMPDDTAVWEIKEHDDLND